MLLLGGCSHGAQPAKLAPVASTAPISATEPETFDAAKAAAQVAFDRYRARDYAGAWAMYTDESRALISQADYVRLNTACAEAADANVTAEAGDMLQPNIALILADADGLWVPYTMDYQHGHWRIEAIPRQRADYAEGVDKAIADRQARGECAEVARVD